MLKDDLSKQINEALKAGDSVRVSTLRLLHNALHNEEINVQKDLIPDQEIAIIKRQLKQREEAIEAYEKAGRAESAEKEKKEAKILKEFLPEQMSAEDVEKAVAEVIAEINPSGPQDFGKVMSGVMAKVKGKADGNLVSQVVKQKLQG